LHIDFVVGNRPITKEKQISDYIASQKKKREQKRNTTSKISKTNW
jgi:hypothetical protein